MVDMEMVVTTAQSVATTVMTADDARMAVESINALLGHAADSIGDARRWALALHERQGWRALGYTSWRECAQREFGASVATVYRLLNVAQVERNLSPIGEISGTLPETWARELVRLEPDEQALAMRAAEAMTPLGKPVTAVRLRAAVDQIEIARMTDGFVDVGDGEMTPLEGAIVASETAILAEQRQRIADHTAATLLVANGVVRVASGDDKRVLIEVSLDDAKRIAEFKGCKVKLIFKEETT